MGETRDRAAVRSIVILWCPPPPTAWESFAMRHGVSDLLLPLFVGIALAALVGAAAAVLGWRRPAWKRLADDLEAADRRARFEAGPYR